MTTPLFSVVIPAYNAGETLSEAIESVRAQTFQSWEVVVVDDGSTDSTASIVEDLASSDPRIRLVSQSNQGAGAAITAGIHESSGRFIVQLGADDLLLERCLEVVATSIDAYPEISIHAFNAYRQQPDGSRVAYHATPRFAEELALTLEDMLDEPQIYGAAAFAREWFDRVGGFRSRFFNEDYDFWLRIMAAGATHRYIPEILAVYRMSESQKTADTIAVRTDDIAILTDLIDSGSLSEEQVVRARRSIALLEQNVAFRRRAEALVGRKASVLVFALAHKLAWIVRPYRRKR